MSRIKIVNKKFMSGNDACGEGAIMAGCRFYAGYPITPQNELPAYMSKRMDEVNGVFLQSESEISAINMVFGAALTGARAMTSSSSPGISLKQEGISYLAGCGLPSVIVNVMRGGPGLGNIGPAQSDYFQATKGGGHGDYHMIVLAPASVQDMMDFTYAAFDLADKYRTPVMVLSDGALGQMMEPVNLRLKQEKTPAEHIKKDWALTGSKGRAPRIIRSLFLQEGVLEQLNKKLQATYRLIAENETRFNVDNESDSELFIVAYGSSWRIAKSAAENLRASGYKVGLIRPVTLWPFPYEIIRKIAQMGKRFLVVEMSAGQLVEDVRLAAQNDSLVDFYGRTGGEIPSEQEIIYKIRGILS